ncbi:MAG: site-2 protease family protein [Pseudomonadota bacterium]
MADLLFKISIWLIPGIIAITFHEAAHGFVASKLGDDSALRAGRVTFNPLRHIDPFGTLLLPGLLLLLRAPFLFGWAKPVPVNFFKLRNPKRDMVWVAAAGPGINLLLAFVSALLIHTVPLLPDVISGWWYANLRISVEFNLILAIFNMIPLPPLDGGRVAVGLLPRVLARPLARLERIGMLILIFALFLIPFAAGELGYQFNPVAWLLLPPFNALYDAIVTLAGLR